LTEAKIKAFWHEKGEKNFNKEDWKENDENIEKIYTTAIKPALKN